MAYTQTQLDKIEEAISLGTLEVWYGDKRITYRTLDEMIRIANIMKADLGTIKTGNTRLFASFKKGLDNGC